MSKKHINAILVLGVIIPLLLSTCILVIFVMVIPNSSISGVSSSNSGGNSDKHPGQVSSGESETKSHLLFILGIVFACGLFVFLIVIVTVVCIWARQARGYKLSEHNLVPAPSSKDPDCHLTRHTLKKDLLPYEIQSSNGHTSKYLNGKEEKRHSTFVASVPSSPPVTTIPVTAQYPGKNISEGGINTDPYQIVEGSIGECKSSSSSSRQVSPTQNNYGTLSRTHLLSSFDEDGYHFDSLGIDNPAVSKEDFCPSFDEVPSPEPGKLSASSPISGSCSPDPLDSASVFSEGDSDTQDKSDGNRTLEKQLSKQDSFQGLPPFKSFDKYLTIVRLDSTTSLDSNTFEDTKRTWDSIEEEDEREEAIVLEEEKEKH